MSWQIIVGIFLKIIIELVRIQMFNICNFRKKGTINRYISKNGACIIRFDL